MMSRFASWLNTILKRVQERDTGSGARIDFNMRQNDMWSTRLAREPVEVSCLSGIVWVTSEGDPEDHVLAQGGTFAARRKGQLAMMALKPARVLVRWQGGTHEASLVPVRG